MKKSRLLSAVFISSIIVASTGFSQVVAGDRPPADAKPLSEIVKSIEDQGYSPVTEVEMEKGIWEIEAYKDNQERDLRVDPITAEIISDRPD